MSGCNLQPLVGLLAGGRGCGFVARVADPMRRPSAVWIGFPAPTCALISYASPPFRLLSGARVHAQRHRGAAAAEHEPGAGGWVGREAMGP